MSAQSMLEQLLRQGMTLMQGQTPQPPGSAPHRSFPAAPSANSPSPQRGMDWGSFGAGTATGAAATGALGLLLGHKQARRHAGKAVKYGGIAAIGLMAYKAYSQWQSSQTTGHPSRPQPPSALPLEAPRTVNQLFGADAETHSQAMLTAMIAAAKADGHLDARERSLLEAELGRLAADHALRHWVDQELQRPLDPAQVANAARGDSALAAEMYLASLLIADDQSFMERAYLDELARQLALPADLRARLDAQAMEG